MDAELFLVFHRILTSLVVSDVHPRRDLDLIDPHNDAKAKISAGEGLCMHIHGVSPLSCMEFAEGSAVSDDSLYHKSGAKTRGGAEFFPRSRYEKNGKAAPDRVSPLLVGGIVK